MDKIDLSHPTSQKAIYTSDHTQLLITYDVTKAQRDYTFDNIIFAYVARGLKNISIPGLQPFSLTPEMVIMGAAPIEAHVEIPLDKTQNAAHCFCMEISKNKVYSVFDKLHDSEEIESLTESDEQFSPLEVYQGNGAKMVMNNLMSMQNLLQSDARFKDRWIDLKIEELILCCLQTNMYKTLINGYAKHRMLDNPLSEVIAYIDANFTSQIEIGQLAAKACMSPATFYRRFKQSLGVTPVEFIHGKRIQKAKLLLCRNEAPIADVGFQLGYTSPSYFTLQFEKHIGCSPRDYQKQQLN
ncbi:AraC-type DNA-binding protein [Marivirga sericea]|uniref:AraC-type DNA-binding protein n=1 Tax=Marivirga sericea TaxID=1028 RepID=A0A1X7I5V4_9BACT|nr:AraC family transcriptional regulator [Marivirga sericea]SMG09876.1 AraC-type DNA-binding protein [Marivirga sericea]